MELVLDGGAHPLRAQERGWHEARVPAVHGDNYAFRLDSGPERPDPASRRQPEGVHGRSRLVDPARLPWSSEESSWRGPTLAGAVIYELHVGTFTSEGTLDAAADQLDRLASLGVTHVELMPLNAFNGTHGWGYDGVCWYAVHEPYGGPEGLARFVDAAHRQGLSVIIDAVYNHLGPSGNYLPDYGPYLTDRYRTPWGGAINLDGPDSDPVRAFIIGSALHWLTDLHVDALRLDAVHALIDTSSVHLLPELAETVAGRSTALRRPLELIAESDRNDPLTVRPRAFGGQGLDAQWADDLHHAIHVAVTGEHDGYYTDYAGLADVGVAYRRGFVFDGRYSTYRQKTVGASLTADVEGHRLVTCGQNHDQVGNRALGERLTTLVDPELVRVAAVLLCAAPSTPMLFMGEEYGETNPFQYFTSHPEPDLAEAVRNGRRGEFAAFSAFSGADVPDPQDPETVRCSTLDVARADSPEGRVRLTLWTDLLRLRRMEPSLGNGRRDLVEVFEVDHQTLTLVRADPAGEPVLLAVNLGERSLSLPHPTTDPVLLLSTGDPRYGGTGTATISAVAVHLPPRSAALLRLAGVAAG